MPLDTTTTTTLSPLPTDIDFGVAFEQTKVRDKKYVVNQVTGDYLGVVGSNFNCASHTDFFEQVQSTMTETLSDKDLRNVSTSWRTSKNNAWVMMDSTLKDVESTITTSKHTTVINPRIIALHGVDGSCSNQVFFGQIDAFCTNGMIAGDYEQVRRKNTSGFNLNTFIDKLRDSRVEFYQEAEKMQKWADTKISIAYVEDLINSIVKTPRKAERMVALCNSEISIRGNNVFSIYSAFTNYASYADERNGFSLRNTGNDTRSLSMWNREQEVSKWVSSKPFQALLAA